MCELEDEFGLDESPDYIKRARALNLPDSYFKARADLAESVAVTATDIQRKILAEKARQYRNHVRQLEW